MRGIVQKRAASVWPQDLDGEIRVVEFYVVVDFEQVSSVATHGTSSIMLSAQCGAEIK